MSGKFGFDREASLTVEAIYQTPDVVAQRRQVLLALDLKEGESVLDVGSGPGLAAREIAEAVGPRGRVRGVDISEPMLEISRGRCKDQPWVRFERAEATELPFEEGEFDAALSTQVLEYVEDVPRALAELYRVLAPGGRVLILDTDYASLVLHTENPERLRRILAAWDEHFVHPDLPRRLSPLLREAGFEIARREAIPMFNAEYRPDTFGHGVTGIMAAFVAGRKGVTREEAEGWARELEELGARGEYFFSVNRYTFLAEKPVAP